VGSWSESLQLRSNNGYLSIIPADCAVSYDRLSEEMELLKQRCDGLLAKERNEYEKQLVDLRTDVSRKKSCYAADRDDRAQCRTFEHDIEPLLKWWYFK